MLRALLQVDGVSLVRGYADDVVLLLRHLAALEAVLALFDHFEPISGLRLKYTTCQLVPLVLSDDLDADKSEIRAAIAKYCPTLAQAVVVTTSATYLGFQVGPRISMRHGLFQRNRAVLVQVE